MISDLVSIGQCWQLTTDDADVAFMITDDARLKLRLVRDGCGSIIEASLCLSLQFYCDHMNNMNGFAFEDRNGRDAERDREDIILFRNTPIRAWHGQCEGETQNRLILRSLAHGFLAELKVWVDNGSLRIEPTVANTSDHSQRLRVVRLEVGDIQINQEPPSFWRTPPTYKNKMATDGRVADLPDTNLRLLLMPLGLVQPLMLLGGDQPGDTRLWCSAWPKTYGSWILSRQGVLSIHSHVNRHLQPQQSHDFGSILLGTANDWQSIFTRSAETFPQRFGFSSSPHIPSWVWALRTLAFPPRLFPIGDPRWRAYMSWGKSQGFNATIGWGWIWQRHEDRLCAIAPDQDRLRLDDEHGATETTVRNHIAIHQELGMRCFLWTPSTGVSPYCEAAHAHPEWFCRNPDGQAESSWRDPDASPWLIDSNPLQEGYHRYWLDTVLYVADLGFDGAFFDGVLARTSDEFHGTFPGETQDGMIHALRRLRKELDNRGLNSFVTKPEGGDISLAPSSYWMNEPTLHLQQPEPPSRSQVGFEDAGHAFLNPEYPKRSVDRFAEQFESMVRSWPAGVPGNALPPCLPNTEQPMPVLLGILRLIALARNVWAFPMLNAHLDPDVDLPGQDPAYAIKPDDVSGPIVIPKPDPAFRQYRDSIRELNHFRDAHPWLVSSQTDLDLVRSNQGACPAFVRIAPEGQRLLGIVNVGPEQCVVDLVFDAEISKALPSFEAVKLPGFSCDVRSLARNKVRLASGQAIAVLWHEGPAA